MWNNPKLWIVLDVVMAIAFTFWGIQEVRQGNWGWTTLYLVFALLMVPFAIFNFKLLKKHKPSTK